MGALVAASGANYVSSDPWAPLSYAPLYQIAQRYFLEHAGLDIGELFKVEGERAVFGDRVRWERDGSRISSESADLSYSFAVLEHVRDPAGVLGECFRIARPGSLCLHSIDYTDHRDPDRRAWDFLSCSSAEWEGLHVDERERDYTNRVRHSQWKRLFEGAGFEVVSHEAYRRQPPPGLEVHGDLGTLTEEDVAAVGGVFVVRRPQD